MSKSLYSLDHDKVKNLLDRSGMVKPVKPVTMSPAVEEEESFGVVKAPTAAVQPPPPPQDWKIKELEDQLQASRGELESAIGELSGVKAELERFVQAKGSDDEEKNSLKSQVAELLEGKRVLSNEFEALKGTLASERARMGEKEKEFEAKAGETAELRVRVQELEAAKVGVDELRATLESANTKNTGLQSQIENLSKAGEGMARDLEERQAELLRLRGELGQVREQLEAEKKKASQANSEDWAREKSELQQAADEKEARIQELEGNLKEAEAVGGKSKEEMSLLRRELEKLKASEVLANENAGKTKARVTELSGLLQKTQSLIEGYKARAEQSEKDLAFAESEAEKAKDGLKQAVMSYHQARMELEALKSSTGKP